MHSHLWKRSSVLRFVTAAGAGFGVIVLALMLLTTRAEPTQAAQPASVYVVNSLGDDFDVEPDDGICETATPGECTLRAAIEQAQAGVSPGLDVVDLSGVAGVIDLDNGSLPTIVEPLQITGPGPDVLTVDGLAYGRHFFVSGEGSLEISDLTLTTGYAAESSGGAIFANGDVTLSHVVIDHSDADSRGGAIYVGSGSTVTIQQGSQIGSLERPNFAYGDGGGIYVAGGGSLIIDGSMVWYNQAGGEFGRGGGIYNGGGTVVIRNKSRLSSNSVSGNGGGYATQFAGSSVLMVSDSVVDGNNAFFGGGIYNDGAVELTNVTISGNTALADGGGLYESALDTSRLYNVTITGNTADADADGGGDGGGIYNDGAVEISNSIVAGNTDATPLALGAVTPDCFLNSFGAFAGPPSYNLIGSDAGCAGVFDSADGNLVGTAADPLDPALAPLADNGGATLTHALLADSPAVDAGDPDGCLDAGGYVLTTDQRGFARPHAAACDMGAFEAAAPVIDAQEFFVDENSPNGTEIGAILAEDPDGSNLVYVITGGNESGVFGLDVETGLLVVADGSQLDYETTPSYELAVAVSDMHGFTDSAPIFVYVRDLAEGVIADDDIYTTTENTPLVVSAPGVLENDSTSAPEASLTASLSTPPAHGMVDLAADGSFVYTPTLSFFGVDTFEYVASDDFFSDTATVTITVTADPLVVRNTNDSGLGSLRTAIETANSNAGADTITFAIAGAGPHIIMPTSPLPVVSDQVTIDASTQPTGVVELDGSAAGSGANGLVLSTSGATVRGLTIKNFQGNGIVSAALSRLSRRSDSPLTNLIEDNVLANNGANGILVVDELTSNILRRNSIYNNGLLGIDLGDDGVTPNDIGDADSGPNGLQNFPVLLRAFPDGGGLTVQGRLNSTPAAQTYHLEFFQSATCDLSEHGEGQVFLGAHTVETASDGNVQFSVSLPVATPDGQFITATATDADGNTSEFSMCITSGPANDAWPRALRLNPSTATQASGSPAAWTFSRPFSRAVSTAIVSQHIDKLGQSRWYKFEVEPDSKVTLELDNLPVNYDIVIYKDIAAVYQQLTDPQNQSDLEQLSAEFAPDMFAPDMFAPDMFAPDMFAPDMFAPDMFAPDMFAPDMFAPDMFAPDMFAPDMFAPDMFAPDMFAPDMFAPDEHDPNAFDPDSFDPNAAIPDPQAYASAQNRSIIAFSSRAGTADERAVVNTWTATGDFYVRVRGRNGVYSLGAPFTLKVGIELGLCQNLDTTLVPTSLTAAANSYRTIIVVDPARLEGDDDEVAALLAKLNELAARPEVRGVVVNVGLDARVALANAQADQKVDCPQAKNLVADAVKRVIQRYGAVNPLEYVVIVGNDDAIPFFRTPDQASLASEINYIPPVFNETHSQASLRLGYVLTQDPYGAAIEISFKNHTIPVPDLAVGRLVETPADIMAQLDAYLATPDGVVPTPTTAFVSGYDFLTDAAEAVQAELESGIGQPASTLIAPRDQAPQDPLAWTGQQLKEQFLGSRHDLAFLAGHFSAASALAADYTTRMVTEDVLASTVDMRNAVIFSVGCHSGYNIVNSDGVPLVTREPDWAQTFARKGATLIAGTGYQYGDTDFIEYSERLYLEFAKQLRYGSGPVALGKALVDAKQTYLANTPRMRGIHEKSVLQATLFGLPMLRVNLPFGRTTPPSNPPVVGSLFSYSVDPGLTLGLRAADLTITPALTTKTRTLVNTTNLTPSVVATYVEGGSGVALNPVEPVLPLEVRNVTVAGNALRGIGFRSGSYSDMTNITPLTSAPATEIRGIHFPFRGQAFYPIRAWDANYFDALAKPGAGITKLIVMPAQFKANNLVDVEGTLRRYSAMGFRLFYSANVAEYPPGNVPALAAPPQIVQVRSLTETVTSALGVPVGDSQQSAGTDVTFEIRVTSDPTVGVQEVWVTYTGASGPFYGAWQSLDLVQDPADSTLWRGTLTLPPGQLWEDVRFIVQAVNGVGLVTLVTNFGDYFVPGIEPVQTPDVAQPTSLTLINPPTSGPYGTSVTFTAQLQSTAAAAARAPEAVVSAGNSGTSVDASLGGQVIEFSFGSLRRQVVTNANGVATVVMPLIGLVGPDVLQATFAGNAQFQGSSASLIFTINKQTTSLTLGPDPASGQYSDDTNLQATLTAGADHRLPDRTVFFVVGTPAKALSATSTNVTDFAGRAPGGPVNLPSGNYPVTAYFLGTIPVGGGATVTLSDSRYLPSTGVGTLIQTPENATATYTGPQFLVENVAFDGSALVAQEDDGMPGDLTLATVEYVVRDAADQVAAVVNGPVDASGASQATIGGLPAGPYTVTVRVVGGYFTSPPSEPVAILVQTPTAIRISQFVADSSHDDLGSLAWLLLPAGLLVALLVGGRRRSAQRRSA